MQAQLLRSGYMFANDRRVSTSRIADCKARLDMPWLRVDNSGNIQSIEITNDGLIFAVGGSHGASSRAQQCPHSGCMWLVGKAKAVAESAMRQAWCWPAYASS